MGICDSGPPGRATVCGIGEEPDVARAFGMGICDLGKIHLQTYSMGICDCTVNAISEGQDQSTLVSVLNQKLFLALARTAMKRMSEFEAQNLTNTAWAFAAAGVRVHCVGARQHRTGICNSEQAGCGAVHILGESGRAAGVPV